RRIDGRPAEQREVFRAASVVGSELDEAEGARIIRPDSPEAVLEPQIQRLVRASLIVPADSGRRYRFRHTLAQEVAYDTLSFAQRRRLHGRLASYMEEAHASDLDALAGVIFHHYDRAGNGEQTVRYGVRAGDHARRLFASAEAVRYYRRGMDVLGEVRPRRRVEQSYLMERVGDCLEVTGRYKEA